MKIKCIIFDMDGVLLESVKVKTEAFAEIFRPHGPEVEKAAVPASRIAGRSFSLREIQIFTQTFFRDNFDRR